MKKSKKTSAILAITLALSTLSGVSAFADSRHQNETWRDRNDSNDRGRYERDTRSNDRDGVSGIVERVDRRRGLVSLRQRRGGRSITVEMVRRRNERGLGVEDLRRGDTVSFIGDWSRRGVFQAWRIADVDRHGGRRDGRR
ncbi:MAG: hypothetical protein ABI779_04315 [Acidobacteriota bacterium]